MSVCVSERACVCAPRLHARPSSALRRAGPAPTRCISWAPGWVRPVGVRPESGRKEETRLFLPGTSCVPSLHRLHSYSCRLVGAAAVTASSAGPPPWTPAAPSPSSSDQPKGASAGLSLANPGLPRYLPCSASQLYNQGLLINSHCLSY